MRRTSCLVAVTTCGCAPAVQAPEAVEDMLAFAFGCFTTEGHVAAVAPDVFAFAEGHPDALTEGFAVTALTEDDLRGAGVEAVELDGLIGALGQATYVSPLDVVIDGITSPDKAAIYDGTEVFDVLHEAGDRACFLAGRCPEYAFVAREQTVVPVLGTSERTIRTELAWVDTDAGPVVAMRQLVPEPTSFSVPLVAIDQQYGVTLLQGDGTGTRRVEAFWVDARVLGVELPEGFAVRQAVGRMQASADDLDAWAAGTP